MMMMTVMMRMRGSDVCVCAAGGVYISAQLDHNILLLPTLTDSGTPAVTLASPQHVHTYLPRTCKHDSQYGTPAVTLASPQHVHTYLPLM